MDNSKVTYDDFAPYYDHYMAHVNYDQWVEKLLVLYRQHTDLSLNNIHEIACGTANVSQRLVRMGYNVSASDRSSRMVAAAGKKEYAPSLCVADMLDPMPAEAFQLLLCMFDSINYLLQPTQMEDLFYNAAKALQPKGLFIFDISTLHNSKENFDGYVNLDDTKSHFLIHQADYDEISHRQKTHLTIFVKEGELYHRIDEHHRQRVYLVNEVLDLNKGTGLSCEGIYNTDSSKNLLKSNPYKLDNMYSRLFFVMKKKPDAN